MSKSRKRNATNLVFDQYVRSTELKKAYRITKYENGSPITNIASGIKKTTDHMKVDRNDVVCIEGVYYWIGILWDQGCSHPIIFYRL
jgi:hypothetical protein